MNIMALCWAASEGDLHEIKRLTAKGMDLNESDYDGRTALHLACSEGKIEVIKYLIDKNVNKNVVDRWNNTPLDDFNKFLQDIETITPVDNEILELLQV